VRPPRAEVLWPSDGAAARARLAALFPDPDAPPPRVSTWRRILDFIVGRDGEEPQRVLERPFGVAAVGEVLYIADPDVPALLKVVGAIVQRLACKDLPWSAPMAVAAGPDGTLYVADAAAAHIVAVDAKGACRALGAGALERPVSLAVDGERLLVADAPRHQIVVLSTAGTVLARWGSEGSGDDQFHFPTGVARAPDGTVLVVDALNFRIVRLSPRGEWLGAFGAAGDAGGDFSAPKAVAADAAGRIFVTDARRDAVLVFEPGGGFDFAIGATGSAPGYLAHPGGVAVAGRRVLVADSMNHRVQVFEILGDRS
jgi:sugar lactone lactonase YvrE